MTDWSASQYLKFEDERTRPARDLLAQVPLANARTVYDLGCGPGNSTELLIARYPDAEVTGVDSSPDMLRQARERLPQCRFFEADLTLWSPPSDADILYSNATFQWVPDHLSVLKRLLAGLKPGAVLAVQMPDNTSEPSHVWMREIAKEPAWTGLIAQSALERDDLPRLLRIMMPSSRSARGSISGTHITSTRSPVLKPSPNGSRARLCGRLSIR
jgi:trans-aconitate 2-methyltransferase